MTGTFWRRLPRVRGWPTDSEVVRAFQGDDAYELWARCALCGWSGPFPTFYSLHRVGGTDPDLDYAYLCKKTWCGGKPATLQHVSSLGWDIVY